VVGAWLYRCGWQPVVPEVRLSDIGLSALRAHCRQLGWDRGGVFGVRLCAVGDTWGVEDCLTVSRPWRREDQAMLPT
jgi:hypothetical protein